MPPQATPHSVSSVSTANSTWEVHQDSPVAQEAWASELRSRVHVLDRYDMNWYLNNVVPTAVEYTPSSKVDSKPGPFAQYCPTDKGEVGSYDDLLVELGSLVSDFPQDKKLTFVDLHLKPILFPFHSVAENHHKSKPDIGVSFPGKPIDESTVLLYPWRDIALVLEVKPKSKQDPFFQWKTGDTNDETLVQIARNARNLMLAHGLLAAFVVGLYDDYVRIARFDHTCALVSRRFSLKTEPAILQRFFWHFVHPRVGATVVGCDPTIRRLSLSDQAWVKKQLVSLDEDVDDFDKDILHGQRMEVHDEETDSTVWYIVYKTVDINARLFSRATTVWRAIEDTRIPSATTGRPVKNPHAPPPRVKILKESWRQVIRHSEARFYHHLANKIPEDERIGLTRLEAGGDLGQREVLQWAQSSRNAHVMKNHWATRLPSFAGDDPDPSLQQQSPSSPHASFTFSRSPSPSGGTAAHVDGLGYVRPFSPSDAMYAEKEPSSPCVPNEVDEDDRQLASRLGAPAELDADDAPCSPPGPASGFASAEVNEGDKPDSPGSVCDSDADMEGVEQNPPACDSDPSNQVPWPLHQTFSWTLGVGAHMTYRERSHMRFVVSDVGRPPTRFKNTKELVRAFRDAVCGHKLALTRAGILHRDVSIGNILIVDRSEGQPFAGFIHDFDYSSSEEDGELSYIFDDMPVDDADDSRETGVVIYKERTGTFYFMSMDLLALSPTFEFPTHRVHHDLESFYWVLLWVVFCHTSHSKGQSICKDVFKYGNDFEAYQAKDFWIGDAKKDKVLGALIINDNVPLTTLMAKFRLLLRKQVRDDVPLTHEAIIALFDEVLDMEGWPEAGWVPCTLLTHKGDGESQPRLSLVTRQPRRNDPHVRALNSANVRFTRPEPASPSSAGGPAQSRLRYTVQAGAKRTFDSVAEVGDNELPRRSLAGLLEDHPGMDPPLKRLRRDKTPPDPEY
ncbi:hypothetical protein C8Q80DRAFT_1269950 [Daedaleopsis nitida]|nr:hypothetical protein C8Q80DRAFT_1269950 [Daedaleopsis nitida]